MNIYGMTYTNIYCNVWYMFLVFVVVIVQAFGNERDTGGPAVFRLAAKGVSAKSGLPWERDIHVDVIGPLP
jgi:hypothetical protein